MNELSENPRYAEAKRHVERLRGLYTHATVYVLVNLGILALAQFTGRSNAWLPWPALGWGIGLAAHAVSVLAFGGWLGGGWEDRKIREYLERRG